MLTDNNLPLFSVVIPVYKTEKYIANTIHSLKAQTFTNFEAVFVDDGSPDNSVSVIHQELQGSSIPYSIVTQQNSGLGIARNTGVKNAKGDWILFLDSDDVLHPLTLETYAKTIQENPSAELLFSTFQNVTETNLFSEVAPTNKTTSLESEELLKGFLTRKLTILVPGSVYKASMLKEKNIWHASIRWSEDQHFMWQVLNNIQSGVFVKSCLYNYLQRSTNGSIMGSTPADVMLIAYEEFCKLAEGMSNTEVRKFLVSRWVLGCLNVLAHRKDKQGWQLFFRATDGERRLRELKSFPDWKVKILSIAGRINKNLLYTMMKAL